MTYSSAVLFGSLVVVFGLGSNYARSAEQDLLNDSLSFSGATLHLKPYVSLPGATNDRDVISMTNRPGDSRLYVTTQEGLIYAINDDGQNNGTPSVWFDLHDALDGLSGINLFGDGGHQGLQSTAFHPEFNTPNTPGYGKFYTTFMGDRSFSQRFPSDYLGPSNGGNDNSDSILAEWTYNHLTGEVEASSYRELFRMRLPVLDHMIKQAVFNPYAQPGDDDFGLLYVTHGDSSSQASIEDRPLDLELGIGKMLRIDPLENGSEPYSIPNTNPFAGSGDPDVLQEIFAYGFRNPHNFSFNKDKDGNVHILSGDIGRSNIEEVNIITSGGNYGWTKREGTFVHEQTFINRGSPGNPANADAGYILGVEDLPANEATVGVDAQGNRYIYPAAQYDHNGESVFEGQDFTASAIASGTVVRNGSDPALHNQFIFGNFSFNHGDIYHSDFDAMVDAVTQLDPDDPTRDEPSELTQAELFRFHLTLDHDNDPSTAPIESDNINNLLGVFRNDIRFGRGLLGEIYISSKATGEVYLVTNTLPVTSNPSGDFNGDGIINGRDFLVWQRNFGRNGELTIADGDANLNGVVDELDLAVWEKQFGRQTDDLAANSTVPEPSSLLVLTSCVGCLCTGRRVANRTFVI